MKRIFITIALAATLTSAISAAERPDTVITETRTDGVIVTSYYPDGTSPRTAARTSEELGNPIITINDKSIGFKNRHWTVTSGGFNIGWVASPGHPSTMPVEMGKSWEIGWYEIIAVRYMPTGSTSISLGFGMDWRNYKITTPDYRFTVGDDRIVAGEPYPAGVSPRNSRLKVFNLSLPLTVKHKLPLRIFGFKQWIAAGVTANYAPHASMLTRWRDSEGKNIKHESNKIGHRRWSCDLTVMLGLSSYLGVYMRYQPQSILKGAGQPDLKSLSTGLILFY